MESDGLQHPTTAAQYVPWIMHCLVGLLNKEIAENGTKMWAYSHNLHTAGMVAVYHKG